MQKEISFTIDSDVYEKLTMALQLSGEGQETVLENCVKSYIAKTFGAISEEYSPDKKKSVADRDYRKGYSENSSVVGKAKSEQSQNN